MAFARKQDLRPECVDPSSLCDSVAGLVEQTLGGTVTIDWHCPETSGNFFVDPAQLELALVNLLINARDAMADGGTIEVRIEDALPATVSAAGLAARDYLVIRVRDH